MVQEVQEVEYKQAPGGLQLFGICTFLVWIFKRPKVGKPSLGIGVFKDLIHTDTRVDGREGWYLVYSVHCIKWQMKSSHFLRRQIVFELYRWCLFSLTLCVCATWAMVLMSLHWMWLFVEVIAVFTIIGGIREDKAESHSQILVYGHLLAL